MAAAAAEELGAVAIKYSHGVAGEMEGMLEEAARSGARVMLCAVFGVELPAIALAARRRGLLQPGYVW
eukprot:3189822-Rhodomonas_salina.1